MPRNKVINRKTVHPLRQRSVPLSDEGYDQIKEMAAALEVSVGSLVDTAIRHLAGTSPARVVDLMRRYKHLNEAEHDYVFRLAQQQQR